MRTEVRGCNVESQVKREMFQCPTKIIFGINSIEEIGREAKRFHGEKVLIVTSPTPEKLGFVDRTKILLRQEGFTADVFNEVRPEPTLQTANMITEVVRKQRYDIIIGVGGGSVMDIAKIASIMATNPGKIDDYVGIELVRKRGLPKILVPTTAGTGSEVTQGAILSSEEKGEKVGIISEYVRAEMAIVDPLLSVSMPPELTASTGVDALSHAIEAFMSLNGSQISDALALKAIRLIAKSLPVAFTNGRDLKSRCDMSLAALIGGIVVDPINAGACAGHAAAYAFAAPYKIPHGVSLSITLPHIMKYNMPTCLEKFREIAQAFGERVEELSLPDAALEAIERVKNLIGNILKLPTRLRELGIPREALHQLAKNMLKYTRLLTPNPRRITEKEANEIFENMW